MAAPSRGWMSFDRSLALPDADCLLLLFTEPLTGGDAWLVE
jgi:hypothetical protein